MKKLLLVTVVGMVGFYFVAPQHAVWAHIFTAAQTSVSSAMVTNEEVPRHVQLRSELREKVADEREERAAIAEAKRIETAERIAREAAQWEARKAADDAAARTEERKTALASAEVVMYATAWCSYCRKTRDFLKAKGIKFREYDIEKSQEGRRQHTALGGGGVPVLVINGKVVRGYNPRAILTAVES